jgi:sugar lactone lactonase YvrE
MNHSLRSFAAAAGVSLFISACGGGGGTSAPAPVTPTPPVVVNPPPPVQALHADIVAGQASTPPRYASGPLATTGFNFPTQLALDKDGNLYVSDNDYVVHKITPSGQVSLLAGTAGHIGATDGTGAGASLAPVAAMAVDASGNVFVASDTAIRKITPAGVVTSFAGKQGTMGGIDGHGPDASFYQIKSMAFDASGNLYVVDGQLRRVSPSGDVVTIQLEHYPSNLRALAIAPNGSITVTDGSQLLRYDTAGKLQQAVDMTDKIDVAPGYQDQPHYTQVSAIAYTPDGMLYAIDTTDYASVSDAIRVVDPAGKVTTLHSRLLPAGLQNGPIGIAHFGSAPASGNGLVADKAGNLFMADPGNYAIRKISTDRQVTTYAGGWAPPPAFADGPGATAAFRNISGFGADKAGNYYVSSNCAIRKVTPDHNVTTLAGAGDQCGADVDGTGAAARFQSINAMVQAADGSLYVAEKTTVRRVTLDGAVTTVAGAIGTWQKKDGTGTGASFQNLNSIAIGADGKLLASDGNQILNACNFDIDNTPTSLRTITPQGVVSTLPATEADCAQRGNAPAGTIAGDVAFDSAGTLFVVSDRYLAKRAADGTSSYLLDSKGAKISATEVVPDDAGNVFFVFDGAVYKYGTDRVVTQVLAPTNRSAAVDITPDVPVIRVSSLTYIGNRKFLASFDDQVALVTLK